MNTLNKIATFIAISALAAGCATDDDLNISANEAKDTQSILEALNQNADNDINMDLLLNTDEAHKTGIYDKSYVFELAGATDEPAPTVVLVNENRVLDPEDVTWNPHELIDDDRTFAFEPDGVDEFIRSNYDDDDDDDFMEKDIDDSHLWGADEDTNDGGKFDVIDDEEEYEDEREEEEA